MTDQKALKFLDSIIQKTKSKNIIWNNLYHNPMICKRFHALNSTFSFFSNLPDKKGVIVFGRNANDDGLEFYIVPNEQPSYNLLELLTDNTDSIEMYFSKVTRLYDIVYSSLPSIDSFIDDFLNS